MNKKPWKDRAQILLILFGMPSLAFLSIFLNPEPFCWLVFGDVNKLAVTSGNILSSSVEMRGNPTLNAAGWHFTIQYEYKVNNKIYISERVKYSHTGSNNITYAENYVDKYPAGKSVVVYYDPDKPSQSVLEPFEKDYQIIYMMIGSFVPGVFLVGFSLITRRASHISN